LSNEAVTPLLEVPVPPLILLDEEVVLDCFDDERLCVECHREEKGGRSSDLFIPPPLLLLAAEVAADVDDLDNA